MEFLGLSRMRSYTPPSLIASLRGERSLEAEQQFLQTEADGCQLDTISCVVFIEGLCNNGRLDDTISRLQQIGNF
ncbi:hypothetical protein AKJ16_DCAP03945 [Drosera capensis]